MSSYKILSKCNSNRWIRTIITLEESSIFRVIRSKRPLYHQAMNTRTSIGSIHKITTKNNHLTSKNLSKPLHQDITKTGSNVITLAISYKVNELSNP